MLLLGLGNRSECDEPWYRGSEVDQDLDQNKEIK